MQKLMTRWKFWKRASKREAAEPSPPAQEQSTAPDWPASLSAREILGLQQLIGNQAVLRILGRSSNSMQVKRNGL